MELEEVSVSTVLVIVTTQCLTGKYFYEGMTHSVKKLPVYTKNYSFQSEDRKIPLKMEYMRSK